METRNVFRASWRRDVPVGSGLAGGVASSVRPSPPLPRHAARRRRHVRRRRRRPAADGLRPAGLVAAGVVAAGVVAAGVVAAGVAAAVGAVAGGRPAGDGRRLPPPARRHLSARHSQVRPADCAVQTPLWRRCSENNGCGRSI